jgi:arsenite methyltransferase
MTAEMPLKDQIRARYAQAALGARGGCCEPTCCGGGGDPVTRDLYAPGETEGLPAEAVTASLGCGNPTALAHLAAGEVVLDLGSGGGLDVLLSARRVGPAGRAYGLDMTEEMLELARANQRRAGVENVEFLKGDIEAVPLPDAAVDVIISNCVVNLATDKRRVFGEALRVLRPGGRLAISDIVRLRPVDPPVLRSMELLLGCFAGALELGEARVLLEDVGFVDVDIEVTRVYEGEAVQAVAAGVPGEAREAFAAADGAFAAALLRAVKPAREERAR